MVVTERDVRRFFAVQSAIALDLVFVAAGMAVEKIAIVHPDVLVVLLEADVVAFVGIHVHDANVPNFDILRVLDADAPSIRRRVVTYPFKRYGHPFFFAHINHDIAMVGFLRVCHIAHQTYCERTLFKAFLQRCQNILESRTFRYRTLAARHHVQLDRIFHRFRDVKDNGIVLERAVGIVSPRDVAIAKSKTAAVMCFYRNSLGSCKSPFLASLDRNHLERVVARLEANDIDAVLGTVFADERGIDLDIFGASPRIIDIVTVGTVRSPFGISRFQRARNILKRNLGKNRRKGQKARTSKNRNKSFHKHPNFLGPTNRPNSSTNILHLANFFNFSLQSKKKVT